MGVGGEKVTAGNLGTTRSSQRGVAASELGGNEAADQAADGVTEVLVTARREDVWSLITGNIDS